MRTINVKAAVIFLVGLIVVVGSTHLLHSFQVSRHSSYFKAIAYADWDATPRRYTEAVEHMKLYLQLAPKDYAAEKDLGFWLAESGRFNPAVATLEEVLRALEKENAPENKKTIVEVRTKLVFLAMELGRCADAKVHLESLLQDYPLDEPVKINAEGASLLKQLGNCEVTLAQYSQAVTHFRMALVNPANRYRTDIYGLIALTYRFDLSDLPKAKQCMADMIAQDVNNKSAGAHQTYGVWLTELGEYPEALKQAEAALQLDKDHAGALYLAGDCEMNLRHFDKAEDYAKRAVKTAPDKDKVAAYLLVANIYTRNNHRDQAIDTLKSALKIFKSSAAKSEVLWHLAALELDGVSGVPDAASIREAEDCIRQMREFGFSGAKLDLLDARVLFAHNDWKAAREAFEKVEPQMSEFPPLMKNLEYWIGYCHLQQGNPDQANYAFHRALEFDRSYFKAHDGIAQIYLARGDYKDARAEYEPLLEGDQANSEAWLAYLRVLVLETMHRKKSEQDWGEVMAQLDKALKEHRCDPGSIGMLKAEVILATSDEKQTEEYLKLLRKLDPKNVDSWVGLANLAACHGEFQKAHKILDEAGKTLGDHYLLRLARARLAIRNEGAAAELDDLASNLDGYSLAEKTALLDGLLNDFVDIRDFDRAKAICERIARLQPHDATIRYRMLELALSTHNFRDPARSLAEVDRILDEIKNIAGEGPLWNYGKAVRLRLEAVDGKSSLLDEAMKYAAEAQRQRRDWSRPQVLEGEICLLRGDKENALQHYLQASILGDRDLDLTRTLLQMLYERQRFQEAEQVVRRLENSDVAVSKPISELETKIFARWGGFQRALDSAGKSYDSNSDDYNEHLTHGQVLKILYRRAQSEGHSEKSAKILADAEKSLRKAIELAPNFPTSYVELVQLLVSAKEMDHARAAAADAEQALGSDANPLAMGYIYDALNEAKKAEANYKKAVALRPDSPQAVRTLADFYIHVRDWQHAAPLIDELLGGQLGTAEADMVSARRMKAALLYEQGYPKYKQALDLIEQNLRSPLATPQDRRFKAGILMADPRTARSQETLELADSLVHSGAAEPDPQDSYNLAVLHLRRDEWSACRDQMEALVNAGHCEPRYLAAYVRMLLDQDQKDDANFWLDKYEALAQPGEAVPLRAELMFRRQKWGEIAPFLTAFVDQDNAVPSNRTARALIAAQLLEDFGSRLNAPSERPTAESYFDEARKLLESSAAARPEGRMTLAAFYARRGRIPAAIALLKEFGDKSPPGSLAAAAITAVSQESVTPDNLQEVEKILTAASTAQHEPISLLTALGVLKIVEGQPDQAENFYRQVIAKNPRDFTAYNNLALLLAVAGNKLDEALDAINHAIDLVGPLPRLLDSRAVVHICRHEPKQALEDLETILADKSEKIEPAWLFHKAWALKLSDQQDDARAVMNSARNSSGLDRSKIDAPERPAYDQLIKDLNRAE